MFIKSQSSKMEHPVQKEMEMQPVLHPQFPQSQKQKQKRKVFVRMI